MKTTIYGPEPALKNPAVMLHEMFSSLWAGRELAWRLMVRNISAMYRQTILGYVWAFLPPIVAAATFIVLNKGGLFQVADTGIPYPAWVLFGTFLWQTFADALNNPMRQVSQAKPMLTKINFPREALILAGVGETIFNFLIRLAILIPVFFYFKIPLGSSLLLFPLPLISLILMGTMVGVILTPAAVLYQDIEKGIPLLLPFLMIFSGAVVPIAPHGIGRTIATLNPILPVLETTRALMTGQPPTMWGATLVITGASLVLLFLGWILYRVAMPHLIARLGG